MFYRSDVQCQQCRQYHVAYVVTERMPEMGERFVYICPVTGGRVNEALRVYEEVAEVPPSAIIAAPA